MSDNQLRQDVIDELDFDPRINSAHIGVAADGGVITLTGHVGSYAEKIAAEEAVRRVKGVRAIAQEIEVRYPSSKKPSDDEIAQRALNILRWDSLVPAEAIQLMVHNGWITLKGEVGWQHERQAAEADVRKLTGVLGITNDITVKPQVQIADVKRRIEEALRRHAQVEAGAIRVSLHDGNKITLEGKVDNWKEREAVENAAWSAPGVAVVEDRLTIGK